ncbi:hypothetical protein Pedsa_1231 [Pseudopedobacter saltans DSM 12145]|uniref:Uncharacterized protein n=1 Tax=Pseudopedobacter saltans (strain ATCC 51119 / DSM 12145 / JCM 21818 / CCUG 39354 / LMG 10337 / NBRC 100064 / NCIMB 13643) TaxID=762903 RepID=F0SD42_PSESL|nr:hypothetical protein [Pseudopedobacter saltans]ADY51799.1 hypothetical protein Pedsa_1231 [Pseudopedobacter saltans DSM 12145]
MSDKAKKIFLAITIIVPFVLYCTYYYGKMIKNAPYKFAEFEYLELKAGVGEKYEKSYNSKTQDYQFVTVSDSVINKKVKLSKDDLLYLHRKAAELGFWDWPAKMLGKKDDSPRYYLEFVYQRKSKTIELDADFNENTRLKDAALQLIKTVEKTIDEAEARTKQ